MGDKAQAKRRMIDAGVPCAPGYLGDAAGRRHAARRGPEARLPAAGESGGRRRRRGMRSGARRGELDEALAGARREGAARSATMR